MTTFMNTLKNFLFEDASPFNAWGPSSLEGPRDCVLILDASGSMLASDWPPSRLEAAKQATIAFVEQIASQQPTSRVGIVIFGDRSKVVCRLTAASQYEDICQKIRQIGDEGGTNMYAGIVAAYELLRHSSGTSQVVLLTDGQHTTRDPVEPAEKLKEHAVIECVGIGGSTADVKEEILKQIASANPDGTKRYRWIGQKEQLVKHFHQLAGGIRRA